MASTYSDLKFELIGTGEQSGTWGVTTNTNLGTAIEEAITGSADVTFASGTVTLTLTDTNASQTARNLRLNLTGTSGGAQDLVVPSIEKFYLVNNGCADAITVKNSTGTGIAVPAGKAMLVFNDGTNVVDAVTHMSSVTLASALAVSSGGTGATTADGALDNLGGTTVGKGVFKASTATAAQQAMDTEVGVDVQAYDAGLTDIAGLTPTDGNVIVGDGANWVAESGSTARTSLGLGTIATQEANNVSITGGSITGITDLAVADGGTGQGSYTDGELLIGNSTGNTLSKATLTAGSGITVTNGSGSITIASTGGGGYSQTIFNNPGTWTKPADIKAIKVTVVGGGGGGGGATGIPFPASVTRQGGHGGAGGTAVEVLLAPAIPGPVAVTVGAGGNPGPAPATGGQAGAGGAGATSSFGAFCSGTGGAGALAGNPAPSSRTTDGIPGAGGNGSGGDVNYTGGQSYNVGHKADINWTYLSGFDRQPSPVGPTGYTPPGFGRGGTGGTGIVNGPITAIGGAGAKGIVIVEEFL